MRVCRLRGHARERGPGTDPLRRAEGCACTAASRHTGHAYAPQQASRPGSDPDADTDADTGADTGTTGTGAGAGAVPDPRSWRRTGPSAAPDPGHRTTPSAAPDPGSPMHSHGFTAFARDPIPCERDEPVRTP
ncbi:hypothetical protein GCM10009613_16310 [Pseudonocardia kongjuensis]|uniref:Uncharacterized protein n=1 Tax=Pseudonocardia kongjuensis TaxID=102227 RepID=A0ABP4IF86_9PSEU